MKRTIRGIRCDLGLTQVQMAAKLKTPIATYQRYERYETAIPFEIMIKIADLAKIENPREIKFQ